MTLIEQRTGFTEVGAGIQLSPNASRILIDLGLGPALRRVATEPRRAVVRSLSSGRQIGESAQGDFMRERFGAPYWVVHRADLQTILLDAVRGMSGVRLLVGRQLAGLEQHDGGVDLGVETASGARETLRATIVVGADGVRSMTRRAIGDERDPVFQGYVAWRATVERSAVPTALSGDESGLWLGRAGHVVHYPIAGGRLFNVVAVERRAKPVEGWSAPGDGADLLRRFAGADPDLTQLLRTPRDWLLWSLADLPVKTMAQGRVGLLGDAAHPVLPFLAQGGALAIEDAACLAQCLQNEQDPARALTLYQHARIGRARRVQDAARRNGRVYHAGSLVALGRDLVMNRLGATGLSERYAWIYGWSPQAA